MELARQRMELSLIEIDRLGLKAKGEIGDSEPNVAIEDALRAFPADEILISTHPADRSRWLEARGRRARARRDRAAGHPRRRRPRGRGRRRLICAQGLGDSALTGVPAPGSPAPARLGARAAPRGSRRPAVGDRPEHRQPGRGGEGDVDPDDLRRAASAPTGRLRRRPAGRAGRGPRRGASGRACRLPGGAGGTRRRSPPGRRRSAIAAWRWTTHSRVPVPSKSKRWTSCPSWAPAWGPEAVAIVPARIVSWPSGISPRTAQTPRRSLGAPPLPGLVARAPGEREGGVEQQHREDEVAHHQARGEVVLDDQGAEDRLAHHARAAAARRTAPGASGRGGGRRRGRRRRSRRGRRSRSAAGCRTRSPRGCRAAGPVCP